MMKMAIDSEITQKNYERELRLCQKAGGDIDLYRRLSFDVFQLEQIRLGLEKGLPVENYLDPSLNWMEMEGIRTDLETGIDMSPYLKKGFDRLQCAEIRQGIQKKLDISKYANTQFLSYQMQEIRQGLEKGLDVDSYADVAFDWMQMKEIRQGLERGLPVELYAKPTFKSSVMRAVRLGLLKKIDLSGYAEKGYPGRALMELGRGKAAGNDLSEYLEQGYNAEQLEELNNANEQGVNLLPYFRKEFHGVQMREIARGLKGNLDVSLYARPEYNWFQMREIRLGLEDGIDVSQYARPEFDVDQMKEIRRGLNSGVDVSQYAKVYYEPEQMEKMRKDLEESESEVSVKDVKKLLQESENQPKEEKDERDELIASLQELLHLTDDEEETDEEEMEELQEQQSKEFLLQSCVVVSPDRMKATIDFSELVDIMPDYLEKLNEAEIMRHLRHHDVKQGIKKDIIKKIVKNKVFDRPVVVAEGRPAKNGDDGWYQYYFRRELKRKPKVLENGTVDYKSMELFESVKRNQLVAEYHSSTAGAFGFDVLGNVVAPKRGKELPPLRGQGFVMSEDKKKYYSSLDGIIEVNDENRELTIRNLYTVTGNVDVSVGDIDFDGDVDIMGNVDPGFSVTAAGNIMIGGNCEGAKIVAGKNIVIRKGCQGQGKSMIVAGGDITGQFFESVNLEAAGNVEASYLLNCQVKAQGKLLVQGRKGVIIGGYICAKQGVSCYGIGNVAEVKTVLEVGIDKEDMMSYQELTKKIAKVDAQLKSCETALYKFMEQPVRDEKITALCDKLTKAIYTEKQEKKDLLKKREEKMAQMTVQKAAKVEVKGRVYPGTLLYISSDPFQVREVYSNIEFKKRDNQIERVAK